MAEEEEKRKQLWSSLRRGLWPPFAQSSSPYLSLLSASFIMAESFSKPRTRSRSTKLSRRSKKVSFSFFLSFFLCSEPSNQIHDLLAALAELMLLGFISLLLTVTQNGITKICVRPSLTRHMLPCNLDAGEHSTPESESATKIGYCVRKVTPSHSLTFLFLRSHLIHHPSSSPFVLFFTFSEQGTFIIFGSTSPSSHLHFCPRCRTRLLFLTHRCLRRRQSEQTPTSTLPLLNPPSFLLSFFLLYNLHSLSVLFYRYVSGNTGKIQLLNRTTKLAEVNYFFCSLCSLFVVFDSFLIVCILHSYSILFNTLFKPIQRLQPNFTFCQPNHQMIFRKNFSDCVLNLFLFLLLLKMPIA